MDSHTQIRFAETPPASPKSCIKGSRRLNFADQSGGGGGDSSKESVSSSSSSPGPQRSTKTVVIKSPGSSTTVEEGGHNEPSASSSASAATTSKNVQKPPGEIQFQFHLSQHYEQSTPPPNCFSDVPFTYDQNMDNSPTSSNSDLDNNGDPYKDPQLVEIASKFVNEIIEKAKLEAAIRQKAAAAGGGGGHGGENDARSHPAAAFRDFLTSRTPPWYRRAHGAFSKWITNLCVRAQNSMRT